MVDAAGPSLIPVAVRRTSMSLNSPAASPTATRHRRHASGMSSYSQQSTDEASGSYTPTKNRRRQRTSTMNTDPPHSPPVTLSRRSSIVSSPVANGTANGTGRSDVSVYGDLDGTSDSGGLDPIRAPTRSSLNKQRDRTSKLPLELRRRSGTPSMSNGDGRDERLGLSPHAVQMHGASSRTGTSPGDSSEILSADDFSKSPTLVLAELSPDPTGNGPVPTPGPGRTSFGPAQLGPAKPRRSIGATGKSSAMIEELQDELAHTKQHLERAKTEVRNCRREIGTLTRRSEDLRETRDRMRGEAETLNNVIARKERMISEILARARTAEASVTQHAAERKDLEARVRKAETEATTGLAEATMQRMKAESECDALRDMVKSLKDAWTREVAGYRAEVERVREETRAEREQMTKKEAALTILVKEHKANRETVVSLVEEVNARNAEAAKLFEGKVQLLRDEVKRSSQETADARALATQLASELARIRRLAKLPVRGELTAIAAGDAGDADEPSDEAEPEPSSASPTESTMSTAPTSEPSEPAEPASLDEPAPQCNDPNDTHEPHGAPRA
ncbi:hypothetical protein A1Q2_08110 [Trichosporon asahii var. asahii CBS 8904]|uniref:SWI5-dependent HO expression protein 3 n=2 Tax=Trichosporon asahii var. asahii TaxID=189963 RepID=K1VLG5_TRIAC|nr:hypothetical protein A1Q1_02136 [Trichosporon asahii var. asahii CBS 2479]EJT48801.1 hypothetical protein A1Q1_02136 [Trichosporon asahii var. asahii CBS 2479]EKC97572.1 hypothetical protein A1Q2_08110 [Trichosporon asahii var. asahii CBS 8904]